MLIFAFFLGTFALLFQTILFPQMVFLPYAPWLVFLALCASLLPSLYGAFLSGVVLDLLSSDPMGVHALNYVLVVLCLRRYRSYFDVAHPVHFSVMTWGSSLISTILQLFLLFLFDRRVPFAGNWALGDLFLMPLADVAYAWIMYRFPLFLYHQGNLFWQNMKLKLFPKTH